MKKIMFLPLLVMGLLIGATSCKDDDDDDNNVINQGTNKTTIQKIAASNLAEVELGRLAKTKANDSVVKTFAQMMIMDHQKAQNDLDSIARSRNINLPTTLSPQNEALRTTLSALMGSPFDSSYISSQVKMHTDTKKLFESVRDSLNDQALKDYVNKYLPAINNHLEKADSILNALFQAGNDTTGTGTPTDTTGTGSPSDTTGTGSPSDTTGTGSPSDTTGTGSDTTSMRK